MEHRHNSEINKIDRSYQQKIREYDNRLEQIDTYFPIVTELQPVGFQGQALFEGAQGEVQDGASTAIVERNPQEKGKFRLCIDGISILEWFKMKFQELKEKRGVSNTSKEESTPKRGLRM